MFKVSTTLGEIDESDLRAVIAEQSSNSDVWVVARECTYTGKQFPQAVGTIVRRDVWVTIKVGQAAQAAVPAP